MSYNLNIYSKLKRTFVFLIEDVSMLWYIVGFVIVTISFGIAYAELTPMGHGIGQDFKPLSEVTYLIGIYFSVVTISSLGYGDMHPMGLSMALTSIEVLIGLGIIGITIAKVTSQRLSYHVSRLFSSDAQKRLEDIASKFDDFIGELKRITLEFDVPSQNPTYKQDKSELISELRKIIGDLRRRCVEVYDYISNETEKGGYFKVAPVNEMVRVGKAIDETFYALAQLVRSMSTHARTETFDHQTRQDVSKAVSLQKQVCEMVCSHAANQEVNATFTAIKEICDQIPASHFDVPEAPKPDQILQNSDEPLESTGIDSKPDDFPK